MTRARTWNLIIVSLAAFWALVIVGVAYAFAGADLSSQIPKKFDHPSSRQIIVRYVAPDNSLLLSCGARLPKSQRVVSCAMFGVKEPICLVYIATDLTPAQRTLATHHERANCNGWNDGRAGRKVEKKSWWPK